MNEYPDHLIGDDVVFIHDPANLISDLPPPHPSPEKELAPLTAFLLSLALVTVLTAAFTALFYSISLLF